MWITSHTQHWAMQLDLDINLQDQILQTYKQVSFQLATISVNKILSVSMICHMILNARWYPDQLHINKVDIYGKEIIITQLIDHCESLMPELVFYLIMTLD